MRRAIYALTEPGTGDIRYVGIANDPVRRFKEHLHESKTRPSFPVQHWIRMLLDANTLPVLLVIEWTEYADREREVIRDMRAAGHQILNMSNGGLGGGSKTGHIVDWTESISLGMKRSWDRRKELGNVVVTPHARQQMSLAAKRRWADHRARAQN